MFVGLEGYSTEMVAICVLISVVAAFSYVYRKRVKSEYKGVDLRKGGNAATVKVKPQKQINPQGTKNDYMLLLSGLVSLARKKKWPLIAPAVIEEKGVYTQLVALMITPKKIIGVCAFGHGGTIVAGSGKQEWTQRVNGTEHKIASPIKTMSSAQMVVSQKMKELDITGRELEILGGYTHPHAVLQGAAAKTCYTAKELLTYLQNEPLDATGGEASKAMVEKLRTVVIKPEKSSKKK
ncbi:MAG: hypothetical protein R3Y06_10970 [Faecalibacterium sp.]